jgi:hypothetical protein
VIEDHRVRVMSPKNEATWKWDLPEVNAKAIALRETPNAVQKRIAQESRGRGIARIRVKDRGDQRIYAVEFKQKGRNERLYILENGSLLSEQTASAQTNRTATPGQGAPARAQTGAATVQRFRIDELPLEVQNAIEARGGTAAPVEVEKASVNGKSVFRALVTDNGKLKTIRIAEDGAILD